MTNDKKPRKNGNIDESSAKQPQSAWAILAILGFTLLIIMYSQTMLIPAIPDIIEEFDVTYNSTSWVLTSYLITGAIMTPIGGKLSDIYGRKKTIVVVMLIYIIGTSLGGLSTGMVFLIFSRIIQGIGISMLPLAFGMIRDQLPSDKLAIGTGVFSSMFAAGSVMGLAIGANIIQNLGWHFTFLLAVPFAIILWYFIKRFISDSRYPVSLLKTDSPVDPHQDDNINVKKMNGYELNTLKSLDIRGALTLSITIGSFLIILSDLGTNEINNGTNDMAIIKIVVLLIAGSISLLFFISTERKSKSPLTLTY